MPDGQTKKTTSKNDPAPQVPPRASGGASVPPVAGKAGGANIPATAALVTLTVTETVGPGGFLKMYSGALIAAPATSSINWAGANQNLAVSTQVVVDGALQVKVTGGANATHFVIDVVGYLY